MAAILDAAGAALAEVSLRLSDDGTVFLLEPVRGQSRLIPYFFLSGQRSAVIEYDGALHSGSLSTRWNNGRRTWVLRLETPISIPERRPAQVSGVGGA